MIRRTAVVIGLLVVGLCALPASAQAPPAVPGIAPNVPPLQLLGRYLELSQDQVESIRALVEERRDAVRPLNDEIAEKEKALRELLESGNPDAAAVGGLALEIHGLRKEVQSAIQKFHKDFEGLLGEEQVRRLRLLRQAARLEPVVRAARELGIV